MTVTLRGARRLTIAEGNENFTNLSDIAGTDGNARGDGVTDDTAALQAVLDAGKNIVLRRNKTYAITALAIPDFQGIIGDGSGTLLITGSGTAAITNKVTTEWLLHAFFRGVKIYHTGSHSWIFDLVSPVALRFEGCNIETTSTSTGIYRSQIGSESASWANYFMNNRFRIPDASTARVIDCDFGDSNFEGNSCTGGYGSLFKGTGGHKIIGNRFDRVLASGRYALTIQKNYSSEAGGCVIGNQIEECQHGLLLDADTNEPLVGTAFGISVIGNMFRCSDPGGFGSGYDITLLNSSSSAIVTSPVIMGNNFCNSASTPFSYTYSQWPNIKIGHNSYMSPSHQTYETIGGIQVLLSATSVGTGTSYTIDSSTITKKFRRLELLVRQLSHDSGSNQQIRIELSGDNGSNWSGTNNITASSAGTVNHTGRLTIDNADALTGTRLISSAIADNGGTGSGSFVAHEFSVTQGYINAIRLTLSGGNFDGGTVSLIGHL